jgi:alanine racemase
MQHSYTKLTVDLGQYRRNIEAIRAAFGKKLMLILKANGYGLGAVGLLPVISELEDVMIGVAVVDEALELRQADYLGNILVMGYTPPEQFKLALRHFLSLGVYHSEDIPKLEDAAAELGTIARVHIKLDTGMRRVGATEESLPELLERKSARCGGGRVFAPRRKRRPERPHYSRAGEAVCGAFGAGGEQAFALCDQAPRQQHGRACIP